MDIEFLKSNLRVIPDFPKPGINFFDVTTLFDNQECLRRMADSIYETYKDKGITKVACLEARGFILGSILSYKFGAGFVPIRKPGKLPAETISTKYIKEYGFDTIEIHKDAINEDDVVLIHDDLLASGGTAKAAIELVQKFNPKKVYTNFIIELTDLPGRSRLPEDMEVTSLLAIAEHDD